MVRHGRRRPDALCMNLEENIEDEHLGAVNYGKSARLGKRSGMSHTDYFHFIRIRRDEQRHEKWLKKMKKKYCGR